MEEEPSFWVWHNLGSQLCYYWAMSDLRAQMEKMPDDHRKERETIAAMLAQQTRATNTLYDFLWEQGFDPPRPPPLGTSVAPSTGAFVVPSARASPGPSTGASVATDQRRIIRC
ncbi:hypothetical protein OSB04_029468 [Centaurea solstitialis]|uniref:Uncharacterized protein n=1 Tax=Centaurea solstitialis TaxID=347529 RepID=A0AA38VYU2_9ASTR|nr:hypothetical protein OSB04_029468 [Centaurea solstitialis]